MILFMKRGFQCRLLYLGWATGQEYIYTESTYLAAGQANTPKTVSNRFQPSKLSFRGMLKADKKIRESSKTTLDVDLKLESKDVS